jgi:VWFA-related protein
LAAACLVALAFGQQQPQPFKSGVTLVTVDVTVLDRDGRPVADLSGRDFEIKLNNRAQPIRGFSYLHVSDEMVGAVGPSFDAAPPAGADNRRSSRVGRVFVVLVDDLSFSPLAGRDLFAAAGRFVSSLPPADLVGLTTTSGIVAVNPTADRSVVAAALRRVTGAFQDPRVSESRPDEGKFVSPDQQIGLAQALAIDRGEAAALKDAIVNECFSGDANRIGNQTLEQVLSSDSCARTVQLNASRAAAQLKALLQRQAQAYERVIRAMGAASGIRHLIVLTDGVAVAQDVPTLQPVARAAAESGVQLSVLMASADISLTDAGRRAAATPGAQTDIGSPQRRREDNQLMLNGARSMADMAGGAFYEIAGDAGPFLERVARAASGIYRIAVEAPADTAPGKDFALAVRVLKRSDVAVTRASRRAIALPSADANPTASGLPAKAAPVAERALIPPAEQMRRAIISGRTLTGLDVAIDRSVRRAQDASQIAIDVAFTVAAGGKAPIETIFGLVDASGAIRTSSKTLTEAAGGAFRLAFTVPVAPGPYKLRFAAADAGGAVGSIEAPIDATLKSFGPLLASDIAVRDLPGERRRVLAVMEVYPDAGAPVPDVIVKMTLVANGVDGVERVIVPEEEHGVLRAEAEFSLPPDAAPGSCAVRATVLNGATVLGTTTRDIR